MVKITRIGADKSTGFFTAYYGDSFNQHTILTSPNKDDFLKELANGVYRAINAIYEKEKKEQLPTMQWQDEKDKINRFKSILAEWRENSPHAR